MRAGRLSGAGQVRSVVEKYRSVEDMPEVMCRSGDRLKRLEAAWALTRLAGGGLPQGLRKFRTIEEANEDRLAWTRARAQARLKETGTATTSPRGPQTNTVEDEGAGGAGTAP